MPVVSGFGVPLIGLRTERKPTRRTRKRVSGEVGEECCGPNLVWSTKNLLTRIARPWMWFSRLKWTHTGNTQSICVMIVGLRVQPTPDPTSHSTWVYIGLSEPRSNNHRAMEFLKKCHVVTMREMSTEMYRTQRPRNYKFHEDALQEAFDILSNKARGTKIWKTCSGVCFSGAWMSCGNSALTYWFDWKTVLRRTGWTYGSVPSTQRSSGDSLEKRDLLPRGTCVLSSTVCQKHNFSCFLARAGIHKKGANSGCAFHNEMSKAICLDSVVTVQLRTRKGVWCSCLSHRHSTCVETFVEAAGMANNVHLPSTGGAERSWLLQKRDGTAKRRFYGQVRQSFGAGGAFNTWKEASSGLKRRWKAHKVRKVQRPDPHMD